ncbi:MAG: hypothetical protein HOQ43_10760 [Glycomyces artemisiae]|uniref:YqaJ viral recombinase domain-containing protein n=1 Tax=Glycomyces artemisiae TaxID=1076443 RepID=A0A850CBK5_9ACTN|nr:hypothetical protein [Glycomyces artemisiae]
MRIIGGLLDIHMRAQIMARYEVGSEEWHHARMDRLGGSEIAAVLGLSPWESRFSLWHRKQGIGAPTVETDEMRWGRLLEAPILAEFERRHAGEFDLNADGITLANRERPWQIATPDGILIHPEDAGITLGIVEVKTARTADGWGLEGTDEVPVYYRTQALWYLDALGLSVAHFAVLIAGSEYREYIVRADADEAAILRDAGAEFRADLEAGRRPNIDAHSSTYQVIRELHEAIDDITVDVPHDIAEPYLAAVAALREAKTAAAQTTAIVADFMGDARRAYWDGEQIAMRVPGRGTAPPFVRYTPPPKAPKTLKETSA